MRLESRRMTTEATRNRRDAQRLRQLLRRERELWDEGFRRIAGVDEAGMGPLAGPVVAAAVIFPPGQGLRGVHDSKRLTARQRGRLADEIRSAALSCSVVGIDVEEIDSLNIYRAGLEAMRRAVHGLDAAPDYLLVDARQIPGVATTQDVIIKGDAKCHAIAAASILARAEFVSRLQGSRELQLRIGGTVVVRE